MPMPTPPKPGEEPTDEATLYRYHLRRLVTWYLEALDQVAPEAFTWQPPSDLANSLAAICVHAISSAEWWVLSCVGDCPIERDRDAEFAVDVAWRELRRCLTHTVEHLGLHLGHVEITIDWWKTAPDAS
jgi:hypothetical protein